MAKKRRYKVLYGKIKKEKIKDPCHLCIVACCCTQRCDDYYDVHGYPALELIDKFLKEIQQKTNIYNLSKFVYGNHVKYNFTHTIKIDKNRNLRDYSQAQVYIDYECSTLDFKKTEVKKDEF